MTPERYLIRGRLDYMVLRLDDPLPVEKGRKVLVRFIPLPLAPGQTWDDLTPEQVAELRAKLETLPFAPPAEEEAA